MPGCGLIIRIQPIAKPAQFCEPDREKDLFFHDPSVQAGRRQPGLAQRMRNLMPKNAETVSRRPKIVIDWHNQCQAEPMSSPCRYPRHQSAVPETVTLMTGVSTGGRHWLGLAPVMPNDDDFGAPRNGLGIFGHQIPHALSQTKLPLARF